MKKRYVILLTIVLITAGILLPFFIQLRMAYSSFSPLETGIIRPGLYTIRDGMVNMFILEKDTRLLVIDTGFTEKTIREGFISLGLNILDVKAVLLTHTDFDHARLTPLFSHAPVYLSKEEEKMINGEKKRTLFSRNSLKGPYKIMETNSIQSIGRWDIKTVVVPGHTSGSACYIIDGCLFTGDTIAVKNNKITNDNAFFHMNKKTAAQNIALLSNLGSIDLVLTSHYGYSDAYEVLFNNK